MILLPYPVGSGPRLAPGLAGVPVECRQENTYAFAIAELWDFAGNLVIVEHDVGAELHHVYELEHCSAPVCTFAYSNRGGGLSVADEAGELRLNEPWATRSGLGCVKIEKAAREARPLPAGFAERDWRHLDAELSDLLGRFHVHWPALEHPV